MNQKSIFGDMINVLCRFITFTLCPFEDLGKKCLIAFSAFWKKNGLIASEKTQIKTIRTGKRFISIFGVHSVGMSVFESFEKYFGANVQNHRIVLLLIF